MLSINFEPADTKEKREILKIHFLEYDLLPKAPKKSFEESLEDLQKEADTILAKIGLTYIVNMYVIRLTTFFRINFYNDNGECVDSQKGYGEQYQFLLCKRAKQLAKRKRLKKVRNNTLTDDLLLYVNII